MSSSSNVAKNRNDMTQPEVREHPRISLNLPIEYYSINSEVFRPGHTCNLSPDGVMLNLPERLNIGQRIELAIFFSFGPAVEEIRVNSLVVWVDETAKEGSYRSGVKFVNMSARDLGKLRKFFEEF